VLGEIAAAQPFIANHVAKANIETPTIVFAFMETSSEMMMIKFSAHSVQFSADLLRSREIRRILRYACGFMPAIRRNTLVKYSSDENPLFRAIDSLVSSV
jgi:hypothetical protein